MDEQQECDECKKKDRQIADLREQLRAILRPVDYRIDSEKSKAPQENGVKRVETVGNAALQQAAASH